ncbi:DUF397 domain-containing protein [Actinomadura kijaniata]|uniref:DUF397 domain-containing protein n=1 Tax=Actinomadura kijaniata TaxID=46161 RepID=UPI0008326E99|nr:DUF397 domain-containing protein [Actinomadura kijaniata]
MDLSRVQWRKSTRSAPNGGDCVELAFAHTRVAIRDSKDPGGPVLVVGGNGFRLLTESIKRDGAGSVGG